jgi:hypothetical protein
MNERDRINLFTKTAEVYGLSDDFIYWLTYDGFFTAPSSTGNHGAYEGGNFDHSHEVANFLISLTEKEIITWENIRSPWIVGMFHDLCKIDSYVNVNGRYKWNDGQLTSGHGSKSVTLLSQWMTLTEEETLCIRYHMGAYEKDKWDAYDRAIKKYPNVLWTHTADMYVSKVLGV